MVRSVILRILWDKECKIENNWRWWFVMDVVFEITLSIIIIYVLKLLFCLFLYRDITYVNQKS